MKFQLLTFILFVFMVSPAISQPGVQGGNSIVSPEVSADGHVTFRLQAPKATSISVSGDFGTDANMMKGEDGVWSVTIGPLEPEEYIITFLMV